MFSKDLDSSKLIIIGSQDDIILIYRDQIFVILPVQPVKILWCRNIYWTVCSVYLSTPDLHSFLISIVMIQTCEIVIVHDISQIAFIDF